MAGTSIPIRTPAGFVPPSAAAFSGAGGVATLVDAANPLPIAPIMLAARSTSLAGTLTASATVGPFAPDLGRPIWVTLTGTWSGAAQVLRSVDGGASRVALTIAGQPTASFTGNANEPVAEETVAGAGYYLAVTIASGTLAYRVQQ